LSFPHAEMQVAYRYLTGCLPKNFFGSRTKSVRFSDTWPRPANGIGALHYRVRSRKSWPIEGAFCGMTHPVALILWAMLAFQVKHFICDFMLQTQRQVQNKGIYGHPAGISHAALHAVASLPALFILTANVGAIGAIVVAEFLVHYHCDWLKSNIDRAFKLS